jgi:hypothetical protein
MKHVGSKFGKKIFNKVLTHTFKNIPDGEQEEVLDMFNKSCFTTDTLNSLYGYKMSGRVYNKYFGHIPLYYLCIHDKGDGGIYGLIAWDIEKYRSDNAWISYKESYKVKNKCNIRIDGEINIE